MVINYLMLLFCLAPPSEAWSIDAFRRKGNAEHAIPFGFVVATVVAMYLIYFDSILTKMTSEIWKNGSAVWLSAYVPHVARLKLPIWISDPVVGSILSYGTIFYESLFFLILVPRLRLGFALLGLALHLGIAVALPLTYFGLIMAAPLLMFLGSRQQVRLKMTKYNVLCFGYCALAIVAYAIMKFENNRNSVLPLAMGVHPTGVYADSVFLIREPIIRLEISTNSGMRPLPSFDTEGYPTIRDRMWKVYGFFIRMSPCNLNAFAKYALQYKDRCDQLDCKISAYAKNVTLQDLEYSPELVKKIKERPWIPVGELAWSTLDKEQSVQWKPHLSLSHFGPRFLSDCRTN